jgi:hypothetical protein
MLPSQNPKMSKHGMVLELIIVNNVSHWIDFKILLDFELENLERDSNLNLA